MRIGSIQELEIAAQANQDVMNILYDTSIGRRSVTAALDDLWDMQVSEKLVRTYRNKIAEGYATLGDIIKERIVSKPVFSDNEKVVVKPGKVQSSKTIVIMPDVQAPLHDVELVDKFVDFIEDYQPSELAQVGDFTDSTEISRWVRGKKGEFAGDLRQGFITSRGILSDIRGIFGGRIRIVRSNHDDRLELYIEASAPGLASFGDYELSFESLMHFDDLEVEFIRDGVVELVKDEWIMGHGDEGSLSPQAGKTAFGLAKNKFGVNVVCGHTHRAGETTESYGYNGKVRRTLTGLEVGHFMDLKQAHYLDKKGGAANWQQAFGILETIHGKTFHRLITVNDGEFVVDGELY